MTHSTSPKKPRASSRALADVRVALLGVALAASGALSAEGPRDVVRRLGDEVLAVLRDKGASNEQKRERILEIVDVSGSGHVGAALSQADILVTLYAHVLHVAPDKCALAERDRFVLSKGHGGLGFAAVLAECGFIPRAELATFGRSGSALGMHLDRQRVPGVEQSTGSLGHGLGVAVGMALGARLLGLPSRVVCLLSDGECYEGSTWEAAQSAATHRLASLFAVVDRNRLTMDGFTEDEAPLEPLAAKWQAFGFRVLECDGHERAPVHVIIAERAEREALPEIKVGQLHGRARLEVAREQADLGVRRRRHCVEHGDHAGQYARGIRDRAPNLDAKVVNVRLANARDFPVGGLDADGAEHVADDGAIRSPGE